MTSNPFQNTQNDEIFEKLLFRVGDDYDLEHYETYLGESKSNYPANWITRRTIADGTYRKYFEKSRKKNTMKKSDIKSLVRQVIAELVITNASKRHEELAKLAKSLETIDDKARRLDLMDPQRAELEDQRMEVWWQIKKLLQASGIYEDHVSGFGHSVNVPQDTNTMNRPTIMEYNTPNDRKRAIQSSDFDRGARLLFSWVSKGQTDYQEFEDLLADFSAKVTSAIRKRLSSIDTRP